MTGINAFIKEALERSLATFHHVRTQQEVGSLQPKEGRDQDPAMPAPGLILPASKPCEIRSVVYLNTWRSL